MPPFENLLAEFIESEASHDDLAKQLFHDGDAAHLKRWLDYGGADKTWKKISKEPFYYNGAFTHVMIVLRLRRIAEECDALNKTVGELERKSKRLAPKERKRFAKMLINSEISPAQYAAWIEFIKDREHNTREFIDLDPLLSVRSDKKRSRPRTLFMRMLSDGLHNTFGRWHDAEVAELCEIAFGCRGSVTARMARSARRSRPRKKRQPSVGGALVTKKSRTSAA